MEIRLKGHCNQQSQYLIGNILLVLSASEQRTLDKALYKNNNGRQGGNESKDVIFVPVSSENAENFDFHPDFTSPRSHVNGAILYQDIIVRELNRSHCVTFLFEFMLISAWSR